MKKTISVNIKGINFIIEEDAYERLDDYLNRLKMNLKNEEGADEIIEDIEIRIAELCKSKLDGKKEVIELPDIESIIETLGEPEEYVHEGEDPQPKSASSSDSEQEQSRSEKRLYRDTDNAQIAGVCQGIANYFHMDVVIIRIIWVLIFLFGGFGMLLYIILWIVVPKANSTIDRLRMKGKPITVDSVREEVENAAEKFSKSTKNFASKLREDDYYSKRISTIGRIISVAAAIFSIMIGIAILVFFLIFILGGFQFIPAKTDSGFLSMTEMAELALASPNDVSAAWIAVWLLAASTILWLFLFGIYILFKIKNKWTKISLGGLVLTGVIGGIMCIWLSIKTGRDMTITGEIKRTIGHVDSDQLVIEADDQQTALSKDVTVTSRHQPWLLEMRGNRIYNSGIRIKYRMSKDSLFHVYELASAQAHTLTAGVQRAKNINHPMTLLGDSLMVGSTFNYPKTDKFRVQDIDILIEIPLNKTVLINGTLIQLGRSTDVTKDDDDEYYEQSGRIRSDGSYSHEER